MVMSGVPQSWTGRIFFYSDDGEVLNRLPREDVDAPSLVALEARLYGALRSLIR